MFLHMELEISDDNVLFYPLSHDALLLWVIANTTEINDQKRMFKKIHNVVNPRSKFFYYVLMVLINDINSDCSLGLF